jgi:hypothetical protein
MLSYIKQLITSTEGSSCSRRAPGVLVITLHQPGMELTSLLDDLLLLAPGGRCVYAGAWGGALPYFQGRLGLLPPPHTGLAEWFLSLLTAQGHGDSSSSSSSGSDTSSHWSLDIVSGQAPHGQADTGSSQHAAPLDLHAAWLDFNAAGSSAGKAVVHCDGRQAAGDKGLQRECSLPVIKVVVDSEGEDDHEYDDAGAPAQVEQPAHAAEEEVAEAEQSDRAAAQQQIGHIGTHSICCVAVEATLTCSARQAEQQQPGQAGVSLHSAGSSGGGAGFWVQVGVLALRSLRWWWRNPAMIISGALRRMCSEET